MRNEKTGKNFIGSIMILLFFLCVPVISQPFSVMAGSTGQEEEDRLGEALDEAEKKGYSWQAAAGLIQYLEVYPGNTYDITGWGYYGSDWEFQAGDDGRYYPVRINGKNNVTHTTSAGKKSGDDGGDLIDPGIVVGTAVVIAFIGGSTAVAVSVGKKKGKKKQTVQKKYEGSQYKLHVQKDFGNRLRRGGKPVLIRAWIEEIKDGNGRLNPPMTAALKAGGRETGVNARTVGIGPGGMMQILVTIDAGYQYNAIPQVGQPLIAGVQVIYHGAAGSTYTKVVEFEVVGDPFISVVEKEDFNRNVLLKDKMEPVQFLFGDRYKEEIYLKLEDFTEDAEKLDISCASSVFALSAKKVAPFVFCLTVENRSNGEVSRFGRYPLKTTALVSAKNTAGEYAERSVEFHLYPDGIYVPAEEYPAGKIKYYEETKGNCIEIPTNDGNTNRTTLAFEILPAYIWLRCAYRTSYGYVFTEKKGIRYIPEPVPLNKISEAVKSNSQRFEVKIEGDRSDPCISDNKGCFVLMPQKSLLMEDDKVFYIYHLHFAFEGKGQARPVPEFDLPVRFVGDVKGGKNMYREEEIRAIRRLVDILELNRLNSARQLLLHIDDIPTSDLNKYRWVLFDEGLKYQNNKYDDFMAHSDFMDKLIAACSAAEWIGDMALSVVIKHVTVGMAANIAEPLTFAIKDLFVSISGDMINASLWGYEFSMTPIEIFRRVTGIADNRVTGYLSSLLGGDPSAWKTDRIIKTAFFAVTAKVIKHTLENFDDDGNILDPESGSVSKDRGAWDIIWNIIYNTMKDFTLEALKIYIGNKIGDLLPADTERKGEILTEYLEGLPEPAPGNGSLYHRMIENAYVKELLKEKLGDIVGDTAAQSAGFELDKVTDLVFHGKIEGITYIRIGITDDAGVEISMPQLLMDALIGIAVMSGITKEAEKDGVDWKKFKREMPKNLPYMNRDDMARYLTMAGEHAAAELYSGLPKRRQNRKYIRDVKDGDYVDPAGHVLYR